MKRMFPIGYSMKEGVVEIFENEANILKQLFKEYLNGKAMSKLCLILIENKIENYNGEISWTHSSIGKILANKRYMGDDIYPQIISKEIFYKVQDKRTEKNKSNNKNNNISINGKNSDFYLRDKVQCGECESFYRRYQIHHNRDKKCNWKCSKYIVNRKVQCKNIHLEDGEIEKTFCKVIEAIKEDFNLIKVEQKPVVKQMRLKRKRFSNICDEAFYIASQKYENLSECDYEQTTTFILEEICKVNSDDGFNKELFKNIVDKVVVHKNNWLEVVFNNEARLKIERV